MTYYKTIENSDRIICLLCQHYCKIPLGGLGVCGVNKNENGVLKTLVYGHPSALNIDPIEKKPLFHMLPSTQALSLGTVGCNFKCPFCQNWEISQEHTIDERIMIEPQQIVELAIKKGAKSIAYTYNEPTIFYPFAKDIGVLAKEHGLKNIFVTNGFESPEVLNDMQQWCDGANVDLKSWNEDYYKKTLKGGLDAVKNTLKTMVSLGIWVEITTLLIEGENDSNADLKAMASFIADDLGAHIPWHLSAFHPDYKMQNHHATTLKTLKRAQKIATDAGLYYVYMGNLRTQENTYCPKCGTLLIAREGFRILQNHLTHNQCPTCQRVIEGIWE
ncbi:AmmeMemoRadiSam system radical SAM enzyme [Sulfurospirillum sp. 1612]|uniref:AmmeMemoRadiSam system radical SAM enzyme n=1 Tax=Sulfurospirillum sp. 1612 TaxID=3094835 RepID=UPI002F93FA11